MLSSINLPMSVETEISGHYTSGKLFDDIVKALTQAGKNIDHLSQDDFGGGDEFHTGGIEATKELAAHMDLRPGMRLLDIGCGMGGPARYFASQHDCQVDGIDLTDEFIDVAQRLTELVKLEKLARFHQGSALSLPWQAGSFDGAYMIHVGMNISDKASVYHEVRRVLKPGGLFTIFDIMRTGEGDLTFPVPWSAVAQTSFVEPLDHYRNALNESGFEIVAERKRRDFSIEISERMASRAKTSGPPTLGLHLVMGSRTPAMMNNLVTMMRERILEPIEVYARPV